MTAKRRHRNPWPVTPLPAWRLAPGAVVVVDGFDYVVEKHVRDGLALAPDAGPARLVVTLAHPSGRRGRPRAFEPPELDLLAEDLVQVRAGAGAADWSGF